MCLRLVTFTSPFIIEVQLLESLANCRKEEPAISDAEVKLLVEKNRYFPHLAHLHLDEGSLLFL